jgi:hypothetical protein
MGPITELPDIDESSITDNRGYSRDGGSGGGGAGYRNNGRSSASSFSVL